jgi:hypothetical protein
MSLKIKRLQAPEEYWPQRPQLFRTADSFDWFLRRNRGTLVEAGALLMPNGRQLVDPDAFDRVVLRIGSKRAAKK